MQNNKNQSVLKRLFPFFRPHTGKLCVVLIMMLIVTAVHLMRPMILRAIIDKAIPQKDISLAMELSGIFIVCLIFGAIALYIRVLIMAKIGAEIISEIKSKLFSHIIGQGMEFFDKNQSGKLLTRTESDTNQLKNLFSQSTTQLFSSLMLIIGTVIVLFNEDYKVGVFAMLSMLVVGIFMFFYLRFVRTLFTKAREKNSKMTGYLTEYIQGASLIKVHGREEDVKANMHKYNIEKENSEVKASFYEYAVFASIFRFCTEIGSLIILFFYCSTRVFEGTMTVGTLVMFIEMMRQFFRPLEYLVEVLGQLQNSLAGGVRLFDILDTAPAVKDNGESVLGLKLSDSVEFRDVSFAYAKEMVLKNVSFTIPKGQQLAIVGGSGSGKTTCINLLLRFYEVSSGEITVDGRNITSIALNDWRRSISLVLQEIYLFPGTIMQNLKAFHPDILDETVINAAKELGAHEFIMKQSQGYETLLTERGANISYGERQLLSYIRAMVKDPDILILDEATSSVDAITERQLQVSMEKLMKDRTSIIIAHRLSTIRKANNILVFHKGFLTQSGDHESLMKQKGIYQNLVNLQNGIKESEQSIESNVALAEVTL